MENCLRHTVCDTMHTLQLKSNLEISKSHNNDEISSEPLPFIVVITTATRQLISVSLFSWLG